MSSRRPGAERKEKKEKRNASAAVFIAYDRFTTRWPGVTRASPRRKRHWRRAPATRRVDVPKKKKKIPFRHWRQFLIDKRERRFTHVRFDHAGSQTRGFPYRTYGFPYRGGDARRTGGGGGCGPRRVRIETSFSAAVSRAPRERIRKTERSVCAYQLFVSRRVQNILYGQNRFGHRLRGNSACGGSYALCMSCD